MIATGIGYDVHRLVTGRPLILGGVEIPTRLASTATRMRTFFATPSPMLF